MRQMRKLRHRGAKEFIQAAELGLNETMNRYGISQCLVHNLYPSINGSYYCLNNILIDDERIMIDFYLLCACVQFLTLL